MEPIDYSEDIKLEAKRRADKFLKKNSKEIKRLKKIYEDALITLDKEKYFYALGKLRKMYRQDNSEKVLSYCWETYLLGIKETVNELKKDQIQKA